MFLDGWVDGWVGGWVGGCKSRFKDCLQQSKIGNGDSVIGESMQSINLLCAFLRPPTQPIYQTPLCNS
jgi:hypothetical protein